MNNFKDLEPRDKLPQHIKGQTLSSLGTLKMIMDMMDLFIVKGTLTMSQTLTPGSPPHTEQNTQDGERNSD